MRLELAPETIARLDQLGSVDRLTVSAVARLACELIARDGSADLNAIRAEAAKLRGTPQPEPPPTAPKKGRGKSKG